MSHENCTSVIFFVCTPSTAPFCSPVSGFHTRSVASSEPEKIERFTGPLRRARDTREGGGGRARGGAGGSAGGVGERLVGGAHQSAL